MGAMGCIVACLIGLCMNIPMFIESIVLWWSIGMPQFNGDGGMIAFSIVESLQSLRVLAAVPVNRRAATISVVVKPRALLGRGLGT